LWLYASPAVEEFKFIFVRNSQRVIEEMKELYPIIYGVTRIEDERAIRWVKWLGGRYNEPINGFRTFVIGGTNG